MRNIQELCNQFAKEVNGKANVKNGICSVEFQRNLKVTIQGRPSTSELHAEISFESLDQHRNALNLGEVVVLQEELPEFIKTLAINNLIISAIHNHWVYTISNDSLCPLSIC